MIKWFDADKFLPGYETSKVLVRCINPHDKISYSIELFTGGDWSLDNKCNDLIITHWAFIEEPLEL